MNAKTRHIVVAAGIVLAALLIFAGTRPAAAQGLPGAAISAQRMVTIPQDIQTLVIDARQWYRDALLAIEQCDQAKFAAAIDAMLRDRTRIHDIEVSGAPIYASRCARTKRTFYKDSPG